MKTTVSMREFVSTIEEIRPNNFSREALEALFEYFEEIEESCGIESEFDPIAICCEFSEDSFENIADQYGIEIDLSEDDEEKKQQVIDFLQSEGVYVSDSDNGIVYRQF